MQAAINNNQGGLAQCVVNAQPGPRGAQITLRWLVGRDGLPLATAITADTLGDARVSRCIEAAASPWRFPRPPSPQAVVTWSLSLRAG